MANDFDELINLRKQIDNVDEQILQLAKKRVEIACQIGKVKQHQKSPTRDFAREKACMEHARQIASSIGLPIKTADKLLTELILCSLTVQEQNRILGQHADTRKKALIIGGGGKMGIWFAHFLSSQGFSVFIFDVVQNSHEHQICNSLEESNHFDIIAVATPLAKTNFVLEELALHPTKALIFDIASLKTPVKNGIAALKKANAKITSIHPMFGPNTELLSGKQVIIVDVGNEDANQEVASLFSNTMAQLVTMSPDTHDHMMAYVLGLSHAVNIAFFSVLSQSSESASRLKKMSSTTFDSQLAVASKVADESPELYFEIQSLNPYGDESLQKLSAILQDMRASITSKDGTFFHHLMREGRHYLNKQEG